uniref:Do family serine endopeptidase n=1 Tax=candidate division WOR-3 bacterium TaxID=2052148 RepID=A0A7V3PT05_UNCW3
MNRNSKLKFNFKLYVFMLLMWTITSNSVYGSSENQNPENSHSPFVPIVEKVLPSVVNISAERKVKISSPNLFPFGWPFGDLPWDFNLPEQNVHSLGSGVIIDSNGYIVTNNHVIAGYDNIIVKLNDGTEFKNDDVEIVGYDRQTDLAVIRIRIKGTKRLTPIKYADPNSIKVGDWAIAIGSPYGLQGTVTIGVISAIGRSGIPLPEGPSRQDFIQTDAAINPGNSGGPLVNINGELMGINTAISSPVGANIGIGFAIPVNYVKSVVEQIIAYGKVSRGYLGVRVQELNAELRRALKLKTEDGILISDVLNNTPADKAGVKIGDVIIEVDNQPVKGVEQFRNLIASLKPGTEVVLKIIRSGNEINKKAVLAEFPEEQESKAPAVKTKEKNWLGLEVANLTADDKKAAGVDYGVKVVSVNSGSVAENAGFQPDDIILKIANQPVKDRDDFDNKLKELAESTEPILIYIQRAHQPMFIAVEPVKE